MDREKESPLERLPFCLDDTVGKIVRASQECPGVYYIAARKQDAKFWQTNTMWWKKTSPVISKEAMAYGKMPEEDSHVLLYSFAEERQGYKIIEYEIYRYQIRHGIYADGQTSLRDIAFYNMEYHPEYFGTYPVPLATLRGRTARYKLLMNGVFWIETGTGAEVLAVCYPIWNCDFSETVLKQLELPLFLACIIIPFGFMAGLIKFGFALGQLSYMAPNLDPIQDFLATPEQRRPEKPVKLGERSFRFDRVCFSYDGKKEVLHDVSFTARTGQITAIVGPSGSGKSTIAKLMAGFWDATGGTVSFGGQDIQTVSAERVLAQLSMVDQQVFLFDDTVQENIRHARPTATDRGVEAACRDAGCDGFVEKLEKSYDTEIGENGSLLSGGERQRLSIARAILKNGPILLLNEATASLDIENELAVKQAIANLLKEKKTVVMIAHTLSIVQNADQILVVADGTIKESGTHEELLAENGKYAAMWNAEQKITV
jgi:ABC-type multidrug transport system fused ATPase/permease subunit